MKSCWNTLGLAMWEPISSSRLEGAKAGSGVTKLGKGCHNGRRAAWQYSWLQMEGFSHCQTIAWKGRNCENKFLYFSLCPLFNFLLVPQCWPNWTRIQEDQNPGCQLMQSTDSSQFPRTERAEKEGEWIWRGKWRISTANLCGLFTLLSKALERESN